MPLKSREIAPGIVHFSLGSKNEAWILLDGSYSARPVEDCAWNGSKAEVESALVEAGLSRDVVQLQVLPLLVRWNDELILVDGGCGTAYGPALGAAPQRLATLGISPDEISRVFFSHLHLDHVAGALSDDLGALRYPNARYATTRIEWEFWNQTSPDLSQTRIPAEQKQSILRAIRPALEILRPHLEFFAAGDEVLRGLRAIDLVGHTPGQVGFLFEAKHRGSVPGTQSVAEDFELVYVADALVEPALHVPHPEWALIGDSLPELGEATRRRLLGRAVERRQYVAGYHFAFPGVGTIFEDRRGRLRFKPLREI